MQYLESSALGTTHVKLSVDGVDTTAAAATYYCYHCYDYRFWNKQPTVLELAPEEVYASLKAGAQLLKITHARVSKKRTAWKFVQLATPTR
jgi:hypothetical protein